MMSGRRAGIDAAMDADTIDLFTRLPPPPVGASFSLVAAGDPPAPCDFMPAASLGTRLATVLLTACTALVLAISATPAIAQTPKPATPGDIAFVTGMIAHHAQAVEMSALIASRTTRHELHLLGERITVSQNDEMAMMRQWLREHGAPVPDSAAAHAHHTGHGALMPGMLTPDEMQALAAASGNAFDRRFLEGMIKHHQGALTMVADLLKQPGAARQPQLYEFAADIDADQRAEITRMRALLAKLPAR